MIGKQTKPRCVECNRITDRLAYLRGSPQWMCADCEYIALHPDAGRVKRPRKTAQTETLFGGDA